MQNNDKKEEIRFAHKSFLVTLFPNNKKDYFLGEKERENAKIGNSILISFKKV